VLVSSTGSYNGLANSRFHTLLFGINKLRSDGLPHCWAKDRCSGAFVQPEALVFFRTRAPALLPREITRSLLLLPFTFVCFQQLNPNHQHR
jgi:hypothetical protein